jgi:hypothetical protein
MFKKRIISILAGLALLVAVTSVSGVVADSLGFEGTVPAYACPAGGGSGGGC